MIGETRISSYHGHYSIYGEINQIANLLIQSVRNDPPHVALHVSIMNTQAGRSHCALARWRIILPPCLDKRDVITFFSLSKPIKTPSKLIAGLVGRALPVHWIGY